MASLPHLQIHPVTPARWRDLETLFGERGACGGCWCMWNRLPRAQYEKQKGAANKRAMKRIVQKGPPPGLIAYAGREPVAWCAIAPRETYPVLENSRVLARVDEKPVWSVACFFIKRPWRHKGVSTQLLKAATQFARKRGASIVEGYPLDPHPGKIMATLAWAWPGMLPTFTRAGFKEVERRSPTRPILRRSQGLPLSLTKEHKHN